MAVVTRYFSTTGAGLADGTSWANRAALFSAGNWSSVITGFNFAGADSLECLIGPGTYTCSQSLASGLFANAPTAMNNLTMIGCDSSGVELAPPDPGWVACMPEFDTSTFPVIATTTAIQTVNLNFLNARLLRFEATNIGNSVVGGGNGFWNWVYILNSTNNTGAGCFGGGTETRVTNCIGKCNGTSYSSCVGMQSGLTYNVAAIGNISATSGTRVGVSGTISHAFNCFAINHPVAGFSNTSTNNSHRSWLVKCSAVNCGVGFQRTSSSTAAAAVSAFINCLAVNCSGNGFLATGNNRAYVVHGRTRDNTSGNSIDNFSLDSVYAVDSDDVTEFVNSAGGDYRIKFGSAIWGKGYGPGDGPSGGGLLLPRGFDGGYAS